MNAGLRIDVDTLRGTRDGVPNLLKVLAAHSIKASFFFSTGPDNMGRHLWRLLSMSFLIKMLRSKAGSLYGWDILLKGTLWPGPIISNKTGGVILAASTQGHEIGLHAWDHHAWQAHIDDMGDETIHLSLKKGFDALATVTGAPPVCSAVPGWRCKDRVLTAKENFPFRYNSDCRGENIFYPMVNGKPLPQPQIPTTLPTYDEVIGYNGITDSNYNNYMLSLFNPDRLNVLTIHAEVEGIARLDMFDAFLQMAAANDIHFVPLGAFLTDDLEIGQAPVLKKIIQGREGWVSCQGKK
jgi:undecaprenyl phosphate-alpha-L-ara4FN deformylase